MPEKLLQIRLYFFHGFHISFNIFLFNNVEQRNKNRITQIKINILNKRDILSEQTKSVVNINAVPTLQIKFLLYFIIFERYHTGP